MKKRILVIGSSNMDFVMNVDRMPVASETVISGKSYFYTPGGKGANTALAAARLGADTLFCTRLGKDAHGDALMSFYEKEGIDTRLIRRAKEAPTGLASIIVENGENRIIVYSGANRTLSDEDIEAAMITYPDALIMQFEIDFEKVALACEYANERNIPVVIDAGPAKRRMNLSKLGKLEIFTPNETETELITGIRPAAYESCIAAAIAIRKLVDTKYVVLKLGAKGCFIYDGIHANFVDSFKTIAVDTTAAGDSFTAALTLEYLRNGKNILEAARYANAVGAIVVSGSGASSSIPTQAEVLDFIKNSTETCI